MHNHHDSEACGHGGHHGHGGAKGFGHKACAHHNFKHSSFGMGGGHPHGFPGHGRARRGDVRTAVLRLLAESPMHGYQIIQELAARSGGAWSPSAGSVYPTLSQLADEGLVTAEETGGKRVFSLTESGTAAAADCSAQAAPWEEAATSDSGTVGYRETTARLMQAVLQIGTSGNAAHIAAATEVLTDARKKLYTILSED